MAIMALLAVANAYTMRVCLNLAITQMVRKPHSVSTEDNYDPLVCKDRYGDVGNSSDIRGFYSAKADDVSTILYIFV